MINNYRVKINGINEPIYTTKVRSSMNKKPYSMPFVIGESNNDSIIEITSDKTIKSVSIRPLSLNIEYTFTSHSVKFIAPKCAKISVEINNDIKSAIGIFLNTPIDKPENTSIVYTSGTHTIDFLELHDNDCLYLEKGAYLKGKIYAHGKNIKICGNGIISAEIFDYGHMPHEKYHFMVECDRCSNLEISDVTLLQSANWNLRINGCDAVCVSNVKIIGYRGNNDGIDVCGSRNVQVHDCFIRSTDDCLTVKGYNTGNVENIHFYKCTLWNDYANPMRVGGIRAEKAENIVYEDIDIIHNTAGYPCFAYLEGNRAKVNGVKVENIRIEDSNNAHLFDIRVRRNLWTSDETTGYLKNISFKNIYLLGSHPKQYLPQDSIFSGFTEENFIDGVSFENIFVYGKQMTSLEECRIDIRDYVKNVKFIYDGKPDKTVETNVYLENMELKPDGHYHGKAFISLKNRLNKKIDATIRPEILPDYTHTYNRFKARRISLYPDETKTLTYNVILRPGKYMLTLESDNISISPARKVYEFKFSPEKVADEKLKLLPNYKITSPDKKVIADIQLGKNNKTVYCLSKILNENPENEIPSMNIYICKNRNIKEGDAYFSSEEANEGHATPLSFSELNPKTEPIMRNYEEIQWTLNNAPGYEEIICISVDSNGLISKDVISTEVRSHNGSLYLAPITKNLPVGLCKTTISACKKFKNILLKIPYDELNISSQDDITFEITVHPTLKNNTFTKEFSLFGSMSPTVSTHMYCPIEL